MIEKEFDTPYSMVPTVISICEDTANCTIECPTSHIKDKIIEFIDKSNYVCKAIYSNDEILANEIKYYLGGLVTADQNELKKVKDKFI